MRVFISANWRAVVVVGAIAALIVLLEFVEWNTRRTSALVRQTVAAASYSAVSANAGVDRRERIRANLVAQLNHRYEEDIAKLRPQQWFQNDALEQRRVRQLAKVDGFLEQMDQTYEKNEVSANLDTANRLLARDPADPFGMLAEAPKWTNVVFDGSGRHAKAESPAARIADRGSTIDGGVGRAAVDRPEGGHSAGLIHAQG